MEIPGLCQLFKKKEACVYVWDTHAYESDFVSTATNAVAARAAKGQRNAA